MLLQDAKNYLTPELAVTVADEIVDLLESKASNDSLEVDFRLSKGKMLGSLDGPNTWFKHDTEPGTNLFKVKSVISEIFKEDLNEEIPEQAEELTQRNHLVENFLDDVRLNLNSGIYHTRITDTIRRVVFKGIPAALVPIDVLRFLDVEIGEVNQNEFLLSIQKLPKLDPVTGQFINPPQSVTQDLFEQQELTGMSLEDIIAKRKAENDPRYEAVAGVSKKRYTYELHCRIAADYSFCDIGQNADATK